MSAVAAAVSCTATHDCSKPNQESIQLLTGLGVKVDSHSGETVKQRARVALDPNKPDLRQAHMIHMELYDELQAAGFNISAGQTGDNITTHSADLLGLPIGARLRIQDAVVEVTGLRNPCYQLDNFRPGLTKATLDHDEEGNLIRKAGIIGIVLSSGQVSPGDLISVELPPEPHQPLEPV